MPDQAAPATGGLEPSAAASSFVPHEATARNVQADHQARLLCLLRREPGAEAPPLAGTPWRIEQGLAAYRANAAAVARRALAATFPTLAQVLGEKAFAALAAAHWQRCPPHRGDLACWGAELPEAIACDPQLAGEPYLADLARLDGCVHRAGFAADDEGAPSGLQALADGDPAALWLRLRAGSAVVASAYPIVTIWLAHRPAAEAATDADAREAAHAVAAPGPAPHADEADGDRFAAARDALAQGRSERAWVTRGGGPAVQVLQLDEAAAAFTTSVLHGRSLHDALAEAGEAFDFEAWLIRALRHGALAAVQTSPAVAQAGGALPAAAAPGPGAGTREG